MKTKTIYNMAGKVIKLLGLWGYVYFIGFLSALIISPNKEYLFNTFGKSTLELFLMTTGIFSSMLIVYISLERLYNYVRSTWDKRSWKRYIILGLNFLPIILFAAIPVVLIKNGMHISNIISPSFYLFMTGFVYVIACDSYMTFHRLIDAWGYEYAS